MKLIVKLTVRPVALCVLYECVGLPMGVRSDWCYHMFSCPIVCPVPGPAVFLLRSFYRPDYSCGLTFMADLGLVAQLA